MTPGQPRPQPTRRTMSIGVVQQWVLSALAATTILHLSVGLVVAAAYVDKASSSIGLLVIAGAFGVLAMVAALLIHRRSPVSLWLLPGAVPALVGAYLLFGR